MNYREFFTVDKSRATVLERLRQIFGRGSDIRFAPNQRDKVKLATVTQEFTTCGVHIKRACTVGFSFSRKHSADTADVQFYPKFYGYTLSIGFSEWRSLA